MTASPEYRPEQGVFRLPRSAVSALGALADDDAPGSLAPRVLEVFRSSGVLVDGEVHPELVPVAAAVAGPVARLTLAVLAGRPALVCDGWVAGAAAVVAVPTAAGEDPLCDVVVSPPTLLAAQLARLVALGPRPRVPVTGALYVSRQSVERLLGAGGELNETGVRRVLGLGPDVSDEVVEALLTLARELRLHWRATARWAPPAAAPSERSLEVADAGAGGIWLVVDAPGEQGLPGVALAPTTPTAVWRLLATLLPSDEELAGAKPAVIDLETS